MIFDALHGSAERGELILVDGGYCRWHLRHDGQLTIYEILVLPERRGEGIGTAMLETLRAKPKAASIFARCPGHLLSNSWYFKRGFVCEDTTLTRKGTVLASWRLQL